MILAIDQGTTGTTCLALDDELRVTGRGYRELPQHFPRPGWVEHDPDEIWATVTDAAREAGGEPTVVAITNQRETTLLWDRATGKPVAPAIVWQDRRTAERCRELDAELIRRKTGLVPDPYFSATKLEWLLREHGRRDGLAFGTVDSFLVWRLTAGEQHVIDVTNASRTMLVDLETLDWDDELLALFGIPRELLPRIVGSAATGRGGRAERPHGRDPRDRGRPAGGAVRAGLPRAGRRQGDVRDRQLRARPHGRRREPAARRPPQDRCSGRLRARRGGAHERRSGAVAPRRARPRRLGCRDRSAGRGRGGHGGRPLRAGVDGARQPVVGRGRARPRDRPHARDDHGAPRARGARGDRAPGRRYRGRAARAARRAPGRRRRDGERVPDAVPGRPAPGAGRGRGGTRDDGARCRRARRREGKPRCGWVRYTSRDGPSTRSRRCAQVGGAPST